MNCIEVLSLNAGLSVGVHGSAQAFRHAPDVSFGSNISGILGIDIFLLETDFRLLTIFCDPLLKWVNPLEKLLFETKTPF